MTKEKYIQLRIRKGSIRSINVLSDAIEAGTGPGRSFMLNSSKPGYHIDLGLTLVGKEAARFAKKWKSLEAAEKESAKNDTPY